MKTCLEKLIHANRWRIKTGDMASSEVDGWNGCFMVPIDGELWFIIISDQLAFRHLSVTNAQKKVLPSWGTMCRVRDLFFGDSSWVVQYHPPKDEQVNDHEFCLHLWESIDEPMPHPLIVMI